MPSYVLLLDALGSLGQLLLGQGPAREEIDDDLDVTFKSTRSAMRTGPEDLGATATVEIDTEFDRDAQALFEKSLKTNQELKGQEKDDKQYRGLNNYMTFYEKKGNAQGNAASGMVR